MDEQVQVTTVPEQRVLVAHRTVTLASIGEGMDSAFGQLWEHLTQSGTEPSGPPLVLYLGSPDGEFPIDVCVPVGAGAEGTPELEARELPGGEAATLVHHGPYDDLASSWQRLTQWVRDSGRRPSGPPREVYVTDPSSSAPEDLRTELVIPLT